MWYCLMRTLLRLRMEVVVGDFQAGPDCEFKNGVIGYVGRGSCLLVALLSFGGH